MLTEKQRVELHQSILGYLRSQGFSEAFEALQRSTNVQVDEKTSDLLEKKWRSLVTLQKRLMDLEAENRQLREEVDSIQRGAVKMQVDAMPRGPSRSSLLGHRDNVRCIRFHPRFSWIATCSDDSTIKLWDAEDGVLQRTLNGHQDAVNDIDFNHDGTLLASCSADLSVRLWSMSSDSSSALKVLFGHDHTVSGVQWLLRPSYHYALPATTTSSMPADSPLFTSSSASSTASNLLASCSRDKTIKIWDTSTGSVCVYCLDPC